MRLWVARLFGTAASQMLLVAIGWHMYELTGSAWDLGLVGLYQFVPALLLALLAGHVVDRHHRGRIVAACFAVQGAGGAGAAAAPCMAVHDSRALLLGLSLVLGAVRAFQMPAQQALTPLLVPPLMLPRAMAFSSAGMQGAIIGGPALGGLLFVAGTGVVYGASLLFFVVAGALLMRLRYAHAPPPREPVTLAHGAGGRRLHLEAQARARRRFARPLRGAAGRRGGAAADLSPRTSCTPGPGAWACCAARRRWARW